MKNGEGLQEQGLWGGKKKRQMERRGMIKIVLGECGTKGFV